MHLVAHIMTQNGLSGWLDRFAFRFYSWFRLDSYSFCSTVPAYADLNAFYTQTVIAWILLAIYNYFSYVTEVVG